MDKTVKRVAGRAQWGLGALIFQLLLLMISPWANAAGNALEVGVLPNVSARVLISQYEPMQSYLTQRLDQTVTVSTAPDWREFYQRVKRGEYQVVIAAANVARLMEVDLGYKPILAYDPKIPALLIAAKGANSNPAALLKGKNIAMANPASLVVFEGINWLSKQGLESGRDFQTSVVRRDDSVGSAVIRGESAAGILSMGEFRGHPEALREQLVIVATMAEVASFVVSVGKEMPSEKVNQLRAALLTFSQNSEDGKQFFQRSGFRAISPVNERELTALDAYVEKTRKALD